MDGKLLAASRHGGRSGGGGCVVGERELFDEVFTHERCELIRLALTFWVIVRVLGERNIMAHVNVDLVCVCVSDNNGRTGARAHCWRWPTMKTGGALRGYRFFFPLPCRLG